MRSDSLVYGPDGNRFATQPEAGGFFPMSELFEPETGVWPAANANGPLRVDSPITNAQPSTTGLTFIPWYAVGKFNKQSQNWSAVPTSNGVAANYCCQNTTTSRSGTSPGYMNTGLDFPAPIDTWFIADTAKIIVEYQMTTTHAGYLNVATPNHEVLLSREYEGRMKRITQMPKSWTHAQGGGNQKFWASYEFAQATRDMFRLRMPAGCWFAGIWVDTGAMVTKAPNKPICFAAETDSWAEGAGNVWSSVGGNGSAAGTTWPSGCSLLMSNSAVQLSLETGMAVIPIGQGGTGPFNAGPGAPNNTEDFAGVGFSPFMSTSRVNSWSSKFGPDSGNNRYCVWFTAGGGNDRGGGFTKAAYKARYRKGVDKIVAKQLDIPIVLRGIQSQGIGATEASWNDAIREISTEVANVLGFIDDIGDYGGPGFNIKAGHLGPDGLHETVALGQFIGARDRHKMSPLLLPASYVLKTRSVIVA